MNREGLRWLILHANRRPANSNSAVESAQRSDHPWQARQQGGGWTINQYRPSRSVHPPWRPASPPGVTNPFLSPRSVPKVRVSAERRCATEPRARAKVSSNGVELVLACAPKPAENAVPVQGRPGRTARSGSRDIANDMRLAAWPACASDAEDVPRSCAVPTQVHRAGGQTTGVWPPGERAQAMRRTSQEILPCQPRCTALAGTSARMVAEGAQANAVRRWVTTRPACRPAASAQRPGEREKCDFGLFRHQKPLFLCRPAMLQRSDHPWQARQQGGGWTINQYRPSRSVHPPWRPASPPGVTNPFLSPRSVPKVRVSAERRCATEPRARAKVSSNGVELVLACAPKPAENAIPTPLRLGRPVRPGGRGIA